MYNNSQMYLFPKIITDDRHFLNSFILPVFVRNLTHIIGQNHLMLQYLLLD